MSVYPVKRMWQEVVDVTTIFEICVSSCIRRFR